MRVRILSGNQAGQVRDLPQAEAETDIGFGFAERAPEEYHIEFRHEESVAFVLDEPAAPEEHPTEAPADAVGPVPAPAAEPEAPSAAPQSVPEPAPASVVVEESPAEAEPLAPESPVAPTESP